MDALRFAATKIQPPRPRGTRIARPRLDAALAQALRSRRLVLLQAPAGFGKTSLIAAQLAALPERTALAWVSLDEDDDCARLFACLAAALEPYDLPWRRAPEVLASQLEGDAAAARQAGADLVNALAAAEVGHGVIVLDDLHRVQSPPVYRMLDALVERLPANWTIAIATRVEPDLALGRWRAADEIAEFVLGDLRFSADEAQALAAAEGGAALDGRLPELIARTQGWPAGLRLALAALRARPGAPAVPGARGTAVVDRPLFDYLASEVLDDMPAALHDFIVRCAVLPVLTADRAAAVSGDPRAADWLDEIERRGLFASLLDGPQHALVLHDLFRDALDDRLRRRFPAELPELLRRAAAGEPDPVRRVGFLLRAGDWAAAESALAADAEDMLLDGLTFEVQRLLEQFPADWRNGSSRMLRLAALVACLRWNWSEMARLAEAAVAAARRRDDRDELHLAQAYLMAAWNGTGRTTQSEALLAELAGAELAPHAAALVLDAQCTLHFRRGEYDRLPVVFGQVMDRLDGIDSLLAWWECSPPASWAGVHALQPVLQRYCAAALALCGERELTMRAMLRSLQATIHLWAGRVDAALAEAQAAEADARWLSGSAEIGVNLAVLRVVADAWQGRAEAVHAGLRSLFVREDGLAAPDRLRHWRNQVAVFAIRAIDALGPDAAALDHWGRHLQPAPGEPPSPLAARLAAAQGRWVDAAEQFTALLPQAPRLDLMGQAIELQLRAAHALLQCGRRDDALAALRPALERVVAADETGHALMAGPAVLATLARAGWGAALPPALAGSLQDIAARALALRGGAGTAAAAEVEDDGLSTREREVLERLAAGDSNKLIARVLDISPHTVKRHVANILDKLGLQSRGQAAAWLREHV